LGVQESMKARRYVIGGRSRDAQHPGEARVVRRTALRRALHRALTEASQPRPLRAEAACFVSALDPARA
jgi:hypothetical protein